MNPRRLACLLSLALLLLALPASAQAAGRIASATGVKQVNGKTVFVDVVVAVPAGQTAQQATDRALSQQGARRAKPPWAGGGGGSNGRERYFYTGLEWSSQVRQNYNSLGQPFGAARTALTNTHSDWSDIADSTFEIVDGGDTNRCPSLVDECSGAQANDRWNDVGWLPLNGSSTLGVTWFTTSPTEADMALNTRFAWKSSCGPSGSGFDVETVFLHENGHVAGLDHAKRTDSVMYPSYQSPRCTLFDYDRRSIANLY